MILHPEKLLIVLLVFLGSFKSFSQVSLVSSNLPIVVIDTKGRQIVNEPKIPATMGIIDNGPGNTNDISDPFNDYNGNIGIEYRGSSSQALYDKKNFGIETWDEDLADTSLSILGMPPEEDWVLHGPYGDKSLIRNMLAFKLGRDQGWYASKTRLCELMLNGQYWGVYVFMEKVKRDNDRVDISKLNPDEISGDDLTGGYIIKLDKFDGGNSGNGWASPYRPPNFINSDQIIYFQYDYPKNDEIVPQQKDYIRNYVTSFEDALRNKALNDQQTGYKAYVDISSLIDYAIVNELSRNVDAYRLSTFLYKDKASVDSRLYIGPIWDYNLAFGNANYCDGSKTEGWAWDFNDVCNQDFWLIPFWWQRFRSDPEFTALMHDRWQELRNGPYHTDSIMGYIDSLVTVLEKPHIRNFQRWNILGKYVWPNEFIGNSYGEEIDYLKGWISERLNWLDNNIGSLVTSIPETFQESPITAYPNPFTGTMKISLPEVSYGQFEYDIFNLLGEHIFSSRIEIKNAEGSALWHGKSGQGVEVPAGIYLLASRINGKQLPPVRIIKK